MNVPLLDLTAQYATIKQRIDSAVAEVLASQRFILGPEVESCEAAIADYTACRYGIGVASGTDAILAALMAEGIGRGDEVITTPYTFFSTAGCIARVGATPVFVDIDQVTFNLDPSGIEERITNNTRAVIPVHLYGQMADMAGIMAIAKRHGLTIIEDAAQAIGAVRQDERAGSIGEYGCFSFFPSKNLGAAGDAGMVVTNDADRAATVSRIRSHGAAPKYHHGCIGGNFRLDALQAAIIRTKLPYLDEWTERRQTNAQRYDRLFRDCGLVASGHVSLPALVADRHVFNQYVIRVRDRDEVRRFLQRREIGSEVYYPCPLHLQPCFAYLGYRKGDFPESENAARETLALPIYPELTESQAHTVVQTIADYFRISK